MGAVTVNAHAITAGTATIGSVGPVGTNYVSILGSPTAVIPVIGSVQVSSIVGALPAGTAILGSVKADIVGGTINTGSGVVLYSGAVTNIASIISGRVLTQNIGSVEVSSITGAFPAGTAIIGSVKADITKQEAWQNVGSVTLKITEGSQVRGAFDWVGALAGSTLIAGKAGSVIGLTGMVASASGASLVTVHVGSDNLFGRILKTSLVPGGGFIRDYTKPTTGPPGSALLITVSGAGPGYIEVEGYYTT